MSGVLEEKHFEELKKYLPIFFQRDFHNETESVARAYPLLSLICSDQNLLDKTRMALEVKPPVLLSGESQSLAKAIELTDSLLMLGQCLEPNTPFKYRLPVIMGEFPIHTRVINKAIQKFNHIVENYHQQNVDHLDQEIEEAFKNILAAIKVHGPSCDSNSLWQLLSMMSGWSAYSPDKWFHEYPHLLYPCYQGQDAKENKSEQPVQKEKIIPTVIESERKIHASSGNPFVQNYNYNFNRAGRLADETYVLLLNAFGMKLGGHFDAQVKEIPRFIPTKQLHAIIHRQLSHCITIPPSIEFDYWIEDTLMSLGMKQILQHKKNPSSGKLVNPFLEEPISFLNPDKIKQTLLKNLPEPNEFNLSSCDIDIISQYLFDLLQSFQFNPGQALGIGANWDGTISLSNESGAYAFKFNESESEWGKRFKEVSLHRQGPSEALMDVMTNGLTFELGTMVSSFEYMSQLQPSEYAEVIKNAIIDNLVTDLFPEPAYHENQAYEKYQKQHVVQRDMHGKMHIESFYLPHKKGTYFGKDGNKKQTPMYRRAGTLDVQAFPRRSASSEGYRESYADNPLVPFQIQYGQSMYKCTRGHIVYDPISADQFLPDAYYGQVLRSENGDYLPFIGVVPKNYDRTFKQPSELCASFVLRMGASSRFMVYCPVFHETYEHIKIHFLPELNANVPPLPTIVLSEHIKNLHKKLNTVLANPERNYRECEKVFGSLFKNLINNLYESVNNANDENVKAHFIQFITSFDIFHISRANLERVMRELIVNKPVSASSQALQNYNATIDYLENLIQYFYPKPSQAMAEKIARAANAYVKPLLSSPGIQHYFEDLKKIPQANLSRKSTPSSLYSALHDGKIKDIWHHQKVMHEKNMPSGYRDPEGNQLTSIQDHEKRMDKAVKTTGAVLQVMKKHDVLLGTSKLISEPVLGAKQAYAKHTQYKYAWGILGGVGGFFKGIGEIIISLPYGFFISGKWIYKNVTKKLTNIKIKNSLMISAAPGNEPGLKVKLNIQVRDYLLGLLNHNFINKDNEKEVLIAYLTRLLSLLYPNMNNEARRVAFAVISETFPVFDWNKLLKPFAEIANHKNLMKHKSSINTLFLQAVFACLTDNRCARHSDEIVKKYYKFYALSPNQKNALFEFVTHYHRIQDEKSKQAFLHLFEFNGKLQQTLNARDDIIQKIQNWNNSIYSMASIINQMPYMKDIFREALTNHDLSILDDYQLPTHVLNFLKSFAAAFNQMEINQQCELLARCKMGNMLQKHVLSKKDKAHSKWAAFVQRELKHELLRKNDVDDIFSSLFTILEKYPELILKLHGFKNIYKYYLHDLMDVPNAPLDLFYEKATSMLCDLTAQQVSTNEMEDFQQAKTLLQNFMDITINAVVNSRLDRVDIFSASAIKNPLIDSKAIAKWLNVLQDVHQVRSLLSQQLEQSPSLDHTLWRDKCILQVLEKNHPEQNRVHKTGLRSLLNVWARHADNVTKTGEPYFDDKTNQPKKVLSSAMLFDDCRTMQHAIDPSKKAFTFFREVEYKKIASSGEMLQTKCNTY